MESAGPPAQGVDGLDDIMRFDLQHFCRRMQPPDEPHYRSHTLSHVTRAAKSSSVPPGLVKHAVHQSAQRQQLIVPLMTQCSYRVV